MVQIIHVITALNGGGAAHMLYKLLRYSNKQKYEHKVISLMNKGIYGKKIEALGVPVYSLDLSFKNVFTSLFKVREICKNADIIDTWLYHADIFGFVVAKILLNKSLVWNIRHCNLGKKVNKPRTLKIVKLNSLLSRYVNYVIYNSYKAQNNHLAFGYKNERSIVIPNGFELDKFCFNSESKTKIREKLNIEKGEIVFITVGRWDIQKDYYTLIKALCEFKKYNIDFKMLMCGRNLDYKNKELLSLIEKYRLKKHMVLLGRQEDIPALLSCADVYISSSLGESFSNSIGEAMACELPCVVTDVGDSKLIVGDTGVIVKAKDYVALSRAMLKCVTDNNLLRKGLAARKRIMKNYDIRAIVGLYEKKYEELIN